MSEQDAFEDIAERLRAGESIEPVTVRTFLSWFGAQRRGSFIVFWIRSTLEKAGLRTEPDFESAYLDSSISFVLVDHVTEEATSNKQSSDAAITALTSVTETVTAPVNYADPTYRLSKLAAANRRPVSVNPDGTLSQAVTVMLSNDFSQLPVMSNERDVKGVISWYSIGSRLALNKDGEFVRDFMDPHHEIRADASLFQAIGIIVQAQYVLIRAGDNKISGIVTASDLSLQFQQLAEPFLLLGEIENHLRKILSSKFTTSELADAQDPTDAGRAVSAVEDLTFGEYRRLLENPKNWTKLGLAIDRQTFCERLESIRQIRNDVMHFDPDGIPPEDLETLRDFVVFLRRLQLMGIT